MENDLYDKIIEAKNDSNKFEQLIKNYIPFIRKNISEIVTTQQQQEEMLTIGMIAFNNSINLYDEKRGSFLAFASTNIKNRVRDELRKEIRYNSKVIPLYNQNDEDKKDTDLEKELSIIKYNKEIEKQNLLEEITMFSQDLLNFGIKFSDLPNISPKWKQTKKQCFILANEIIHNEKMKTNFLKEKRIPQTELSKIYNISIKTIEKHRKYIVTVVIMLLGDYPNIKSFLPEYRNAK